MIKSKNNIYSASDTFSSYYSFIRWHYFKVRNRNEVIITSIAMSMMLVPFKLLYLITSDSNLNIPLELLIFFVIATICVYPFIMLLGILCPIIWFQKFIIEDDKIIDLFPIKRGYKIIEIDNIVLMSPILAHISLKTEGDIVSTTTYWFGTSEENWQEFLSLLISKCPQIADRIFINSDDWRVPLWKILINPSRWGGQEFIKSSVKDSYSEILKRQQN